MSKNLALAACGLVATAAFALAAQAATGPVMGPAHTTSQKSFVGYYDGHKDIYLNTDVSSKAQARAMHVNFSAKIGTVKNLPEIYLVEGKAAPGQLAVFGSEPGEPSYSPLWDETLLVWKASAKPVLITSDTQIDQLEKKKVLTERDGGAVLNCPIISVGK